MATLQDVKNAYTLGKKESDQLKIAQDTRETSPNARRQFIPERYGVGGYEDNPFDDFGDYRGPAIQNPQTGLFEWATNQLQINPQQLANLKMWPNLEGIGVTIPKDDSEYGEASGPNKKELEEKGWSNLPQMTNQNVAHSPSGTYDEYGRPRDKAPWKGVDPSGNPITIPWLKEYYQKQHPNRERLHNQKYHQVSDASALTNYLKAIGQNQRTGSMRDSNLKGQELIEALKIGVEKLKA
tara:strand:- start:46 stop:762 length:717 start_codon:yes stop_codon:yes gene_type:complete